MKTYFAYHVPKYTEILQIALMLLRYPKEEINLPRSNTLDFRKVSSSAFVEQFMNKLSEYDLAPEKTDECPEEYRINKLLERCTFSLNLSG